MVEHNCIQEATIATLNERTLNFSRRFDELNTKTDTQTEKLDKIETIVNAIALKLAVEKVDNKWKHRFNLLLFGAGGGAVGSGGVIGLLKAIGMLK